MKVAQVVPYMSHDAAFGGPVSVAVAQAEQLKRMGHTVDLLAGWDGNQIQRVNVDHVKTFHAKRVLKRRLATIMSPSLAIALLKNATKYDVVHIHGGRDIVSLMNYAALRLSGHKNVVIQTHGMVLPNRRLMVKIVDAIFVRPAFARAKVLLALSEPERKGLIGVFPGSRVEVVDNGVQVMPEGRRNEGRPRVLFLARLHPRKNAPAFARAASQLLAEGSDAEFCIVGPDEGDGDSVQTIVDQVGRKDRLDWTGPALPGTSLALLSDADIYVLPSRGEVYPMTVLEALSVGTAVLLGRTCAIAPILDGASAAVLVEPDGSDLAHQIDALIRSPERRANLVAAGRQLVEEHFSISAVMVRMEHLYLRDRQESVRCES